MVAQDAHVSEAPLFRYTRFALAVAVAGMWAYAFRFKVGPLPTTVLEILVLVTVALYLVHRYRVRDWTLPARTSLEIPTALFVLAAIIGIFVSTQHIGALGLFRAYFIEPLLIFYIALDLMRTTQHFRVVLLGFAVGATLFAILNLGAWAIVLLHHGVIATGNAPEFLYTSPNDVAMYYEPPLAIAAGFALYSNDSRDRQVAIACLVFLLPATVLTLSRAGLLTLAVLALVAVITMPQRRLKLALLGGAVVSGLVISQLPYVSSRLFRQFDPSYHFNTFEGRLQIWSDTLHMLRDHPIFGAGLRGYTDVMTPYITPPRTPELFPHDLWLALWSEVGLLGLVAFVALLAILLWQGWRAFAGATGFYRALLWGTSAAFITIVVHGMFDTPYLKNDYAVEFWILAALQIAAIRMQRASFASDQKPDARALWKKE